MTNPVYAADIDGTILPYGMPVSDRYNKAILNIIPKGTPVTLITNQGGINFHKNAPDVYPSPETVADRIIQAANWLHGNERPVYQVLIATYHPKADSLTRNASSQALRRCLIEALHQPWNRNRNFVFTIFATERARKPSPFMLKHAHATIYIGDSNEDSQAAIAAGIHFIPVARFIGL